jgi:hypothetical protein
VCPEKTKSLESSKRKHKSSKAISDADLQAATYLAGHSRMKMKKVVKKVVAAEVRRVEDQERPSGRWMTAPQ